MKKFRNIAIIALATSLLFSCVGCKNDEDDDSSSTIDKNHLAQITESDGYFVKSGASEYKILIPATTDTLIDFAVSELNYFLENTSGTTLPVVTDDTVTEASSGKYISIGETSIVVGENLVEWKKDLGNDGYVVKTVDDDVILLGGSSYGSLYSTYEFIERNLKAKVYAVDEIVFTPSKNIKLLNMDIREVPDIARRAISSYHITNNSTYRRRMRFMLHTENWTYWTHSHFAFIPKETYYEKHRDWYSPDAEATQLCLTNEEMTAEMIKNVIAFLEENPNEEIVTLGQQDDNSFCECSNCAPQVLKYKESGVMVRFVNKVANAVQAHFDEKGEGRKIQFATYAYQKTQVPPVDDNGNVLDPSVYPANNVSIIIAPLTACYSHPINNADCNAIAKQTFEGWQKVNATIYARFYSAQYAYYFVPFVQYGNMAKNYEITDEYGAEYIFDTAVGESRTSGFQDLLAYLQSELMWNYSQNVRDLIDDFMKAYYKDAYEPMKELLELQEMYFAKLENDGEHNLCFIPSANKGGNYFFENTIFTKEYLRQQELIIEEALNKIAPLKQTDNALYQKLKNRIDAEKTSYIYWQLTFWKDYFTKEQIAQKIDEFESICNAIGIDRWAEYNAAAGADKSIATLVADWRTKLL
ncbi:MAG: DUF4838 domain-containing protein [Clostridia bacterium]|nr:DUF4838 domain-containing protein [Clostridia bacterium]